MKKKDEETIKFSENNNLNYMLFSVQELTFKESKQPLLNEKTLITKIFPIHSSFSIFPKEIFEIKKGKLLEYDYIKSIQKELIYENLESNLIELLNKFFKPTHGLAPKDKNEFILFGHFDRPFKVNNSFCLWFNNENLLFYDGNGNLIKSTQKYSKELSKKKYSLICSKYEIKQD